ncbi:MAG: isoleucine--tRNA ligase [Actinomycetota bacterium]|nr:MAG: isoleucine--tRNA ligase [Actinomycetota bacterium]
MQYFNVSQQLNLPAIEQKILDFWEKDGTFLASIAQRPKDGTEFVFYDGPPFANGLPHYGHLLTGFVKDAIPRYQTMKGRRVERRFGWDCHGLPAEMAAEKELGVTGRQEIEEFGIDRFNGYCRTLVQRTTSDWHRYVTRQARWVDFEDDYKTMDSSFMESVIWTFSQLFSKGLIYEGYRVLPYCWECETPLSNFETRQDDSYRMRMDPAVTVAFKLNSSGGAREIDKEAELVVWTTTPWTLPSNMAIAVGPDIEYALVETETGRRLIIAAARLDAYSKELGEFRVIETVPGSYLAGRTYQPLFDFYKNAKNAFRILTGDFVATDEGTGVVHMSPGFGEDDQRLCEANGIETVCPVDDRARFDPIITKYAGMQVFDANPAIIADLKAQGSLIKREGYEHSYPHCWRTDTPLIYKAVSSWFVSVTSVKDMLLANNQKINWVPEHVKDGAFGKWLEGARDWSLTRNRFWGAPIPVWKSDNPDFPRIDVYGSLDDLEADFGMRPADLHRPYIDELVRANPDDPSGKSMMRRVPDVLDCWFESGSMPWAQLHYPFENKSNFEAHFPADFIVEYIGQTRGWFYTLHVLSVALFDEPPFSNCIAHGILLGTDGRKLSKRLGNYPDPWDVFETIGADAMRWFLLSSSVLRGNDTVVDRSGIQDAVKRVINPIWNAYYFLSLYGNVDEIKGELVQSATNVLDRYILAKTRELLDLVTQRMDLYDLYNAAALIENYLDALNNWYIRRSRDRFWKEVSSDPGQNQDKVDAYNTLHTVLSALVRIAAPLLPLLAEEIFKGLSGERSVHLKDWMSPDELPSEPGLVYEMDLVREVCSNAHSIRKALGIRARLPLAELIVAAPEASRLEPYIELIADEVNVKKVTLSAQTSEYATQTLGIIPGAIGPRLGKETQTVIRASKSGDWHLDESGKVTAAGIELLPEEFELRIKPNASDSSRVLSDLKSLVVLDVAITRDLELEGIARDIIRLVQNARKDSNFHVSDRIDVTVVVRSDPESKITRAFRSHAELISSSILARSLEVHTKPRDPHAESVFDLQVGDAGTMTLAMSR